MIQLNAYDLDKTLIPYDSFNRFLKELLCINPFFVGWILFLRLLRVYSATAMKQRINDLVESDEKHMQFAQKFAKQVALDVRWPRILQGTTLILSASPICYIQYLADELHCEVAASKRIGGHFINMYAEEKLKYLQSYYPVTKYEWYYAASDCESDLCWMTKFKEFEIIK